MVNKEQVDDALEALLIKGDFHAVAAVQTRLMLEMRNILHEIMWRLPRVPIEDDSEGGPR